jgi:hypothetical protein
MVTAVAGEAEAAANEDEASVVDSVAGEGAEWECRCRCVLEDGTRPHVQQMDSKGSKP